MRNNILAAFTTLLSIYLAGCSANSGIGSTTSSTSTTPATPRTPVVAAPATVKLSVLPASLVVGQTAVATWTSSDDTSCEATGAWSGAIALSNTAGFTIGPLTTAGTYSYAANCTGAGGTGTSVAVVTVGSVPAPTMQLAITPDTIAPGASGRITWSSTNATTCTGSGGTGTDLWQGAQPTADSVGFASGPITTAGQYAYHLTCAGPGGSSQTTQILTVSAAAAPAPPVLSFAAQPTVVQPGQATAFSWSATAATACAASGGSGADAWKGALPISSTGTTSGPLNTAGTYSFTLTCSGAGGGTAKSVDVAVSASLTPPAVSVDLSVAPTQIVAGTAAELTWSTVNANACTASGSWSGSEQLLGSDVSTGTLTTPAVYAYALTCSGVGGSGSGIVHLTVTPAAASISAFAAAPVSVPAGGSTTLSWTTSSATSCTAGGGTGSDGWGGAASTNSAGTPVGPLTTPGTYIYTLSCIGPGGVGTPGSVSVTVTAATPSAADITSFTATPSTVALNQPATLAWSTTNATSCTASGGTGSWAGPAAPSSSGTTTGAFSTAGTYTYTLTCTGPGGVGAPDSVAVNVNPAPSSVPAITAFSVAPNPIQAGQAASLAWSSTGATGCTASGGTGSDGWSGAMPATSTGTSTGAILVGATYTYTLTCTGAGGTSAPNSVVLNVTTAPPPPVSINSFTASPNTLVTGQTTQLSWTTTSATACTGTGGTGSDAWAVAQAVSNSGLTIGPLNTAGDYVYTLSCSGAAGSNAQRSVAVNVNSTAPAASIVSFVATPTAVGVGGSASLAWSSNNATSCTATGGTGSDGWGSTVGATSTGTTIGPINQTGAVNYTLTCTGPGGPSVSSTVTINVSATTPPATILGLTATPSTIQVGQAPTLAWSSANATACTATGGTGSDGWNGSRALQSTGTVIGAIAAPGSYVYYLTCTGPGGTSAPSSASVTATTAVPAASIGTFAAAPSVLQTGQSTSLTWSTSNATSCVASGGDGADGWSGTVAVASSGTHIGPINTVGTYVYTLTCSGPGGPGAPVSVSVTANNAPAAPSILSFTATPSTIQAAQSTNLAWSTSNASTCTAGGSGATEGWSGAQAANSAGVPVGPLSAGSATFTLTCAGTGGTSAPSSVSVTIDAPIPAQPTVALSVSDSGHAALGTSPSFSWTSTNATTCTASGGSTGDGWPGTKPVSSTGVAVGPLATPGTYTYTLTCSGAGGTGSGSVQVTVAPAVGYDCSIPGLATAALVAPAVSVTNMASSLCLAGCTTANDGNIIDSNPSNYATVTIPLGVTGSENLSVDGTVSYPAGTTVGFIVSNVSGLINLSLLGGLTVQTSLGGIVQQTAIKGGLLQLQAAGLLSVNQYAGFVDFTATKAFDSVSLSAGALLSLGATWQVYSACVSH